jgi:hypothetical protein
VQIALRRDDVDMVGLDKESVLDQFNWDLCVVRKNFVEHRRHGSQMIDDGDGDAHVGGRFSSERI